MHPHPHKSPHHGHDESEEPPPGLPPIDPDDGVAPVGIPAEGTDDEAPIAPA